MTGALKVSALTVEVLLKFKRTGTILLRNVVGGQVKGD